jgi:hypothetical protein
MTGPRSRDVSNVGQALPLGATQRALKRGYAASASAASLEAGHLPAQTIGSDREMDVIERDGKKISVPRYSSGRGDDCLEGAVAGNVILRVTLPVVQFEQACPN